MERALCARVVVFTRSVAHEADAIHRTALAVLVARVASLIARSVVDADADVGEQGHAHLRSAARTRVRGIAELTTETVEALEAAAAIARERARAARIHVALKAAR